MRKTRFLIVGLGVMGGSYAMGLTKKGHTVAAVDKDPVAIRFALKKGIIQEGTTGDPTDLIAKTDCIILGLYPADIVPWLEAYGAAIQPRTFVTDIAGVKSCFLDAAQNAMPQGSEFISTHPMAGREKTGVQWADDAIFKGANYLMVPTARNTERGKGFAFALAAELGFAHVSELSPEEHDTMIGYVSQLTHAIAVSLMNASDDPRLPEVTGDSFRDLTRIADINAGLWSELFLANAPALTAEIDSFTQSLGEIRTCLVNGDRAALERLLEKSGTRRREFNRR